MDSDEATERRGCVSYWMNHPFTPVAAISSILMVERELVLPILPLFVLKFSEDPWMVAVIGSCMGIGRCVANIPSGALVNRYGSRNTFLMSCFLEATAALIGLLNNSAYAFAFSRFVSGAALSVFNVSRQVCVAEMLDKTSRGKINSVFAGIRRGATLISPILAGLTIEFVSFRFVFLLQLILCGLTTILSLRVENDDEHKPSVIPTSEEPIADDDSLNKMEQAHLQQQEENDDDVLEDKAQVHQGKTTLWEEMKAYLTTYRIHKYNLLRLSVFGFLITMLRATRRIDLPYIADRQGFSESQIGAAVGLGSAFDALMVPLGGYTQDRFGRKIVGIVSSILYAISFYLLVNAATFTEICVASVVGGIGNGFTAGVLMTIATDLAGTDMSRRGQIIGIFQLISDSGSIIGPIISTSVGELLLTFMSIFTTGWAGLVMPETMHFSSSDDLAPPNDDLYKPITPSPTTKTESDDLAQQTDLEVELQQHDENTNSISAQ